MAVLLVVSVIVSGAAASAAGVSAKGAIVSPWTIWADAVVAVSANPKPIAAKFANHAFAVIAPSMASLPVFTREPRLRSSTSQCSLAGFVPVAWMRRRPTGEICLALWHWL